MVINAKKLNAIKNASETTRQMKELSQIQSNELARQAKMYADFEKAYNENIKFETKTKIAPINLLEQLNEQTSELIKQNEKLSNLTKWLIFLTSVLVICTIVLTYYTSRVIS